MLRLERPQDSVLREHPQPSARPAPRRLLALALALALALPLALPLMGACAGEGDDPASSALDELDQDRVDPAVWTTITAARQALRERPEDPRAALELGMILDANELFEEARACYREAARHAPGEARAWYHLGRMEAELGDPDAALQALGRAQALEARHAPIFWRRGLLLLETGRPLEARGAFLQATLLAPGDPSGWIGLARVALDQDDPDTALQALDQAAGLPPVDPYVRRLRARAWRQLGEEERARAELRDPSERTAAWIDPWEEEVFLRAAGYQDDVRDARELLAEGRAAEALARIEPLAREHPDDVTLAGMWTSALVQLGRLDEALQRTEDAERHHPHHYRLVTNRAMVLELMDRRAEAREAIERAIALHPAHADAHAFLGHLELRDGAAARAAESFQRAVDCGRRDAATWLLLAEAHARAGDNAEAELAWERAQELDPDPARSRTVAKLITRESG